MVVAALKIIGPAELYWKPRKLFESRGDVRPTTKAVLDVLESGEC